LEAGDVVRLQNLHECWGTFALITQIHITSAGTGQIHVIANGMNAAIPWCGHEKYISDVITERDKRIRIECEPEINNAGPGQ
jgi:hypothetical protein